MRSLGFALMAVVATAAMGAPPVEVVGLFKDRAFVRTSAGDTMLRVGETSADGVSLVSSDADKAVVRYQGETHTLRLSKRVASSFEKPQNTALSISSDQLGQYRVRGTINNQMVGFLVDTGASVVAMSENQARALGLDYMNGEEGSVVTAQGQVSSHFITLDEVGVGGLKAHHIQAAVIQGAYPVEILLGMSFLRKVKLQEDEGVMTLTQKF